MNETYEDTGNDLFRIIYDPYYDPGVWPFRFLVWTYLMHTYLNAWFGWSIFHKWY